MSRPKLNNSMAEQQLDKAQEQFEEFDANVKSLTMDRMNETPKQEVEPQTKLSQSEIAKSNEIYLKPNRSIGCNQKFNEKFRAQYEFDKEYVYFTAENKEIIGEEIELWTRPYGGLPAEFWKVPVNKPVWGPRYLAEQIKRKFYHRLVMDTSSRGSMGNDQMGTYYGQMAVDTTIARLDAHAVSTKKSVFMGSTNFSTQG